jgi:transposase
MARPLTVHPPTAQQLRHIHRFLETPLEPWQRRRAEALLLLGAGHPAVFIANMLEVHVNTIYADLHAFACHGLGCLRPTRRRGAPPRLTPAQIKAIWRLAEKSPLALGLSFARWSLAKLRAYLIRERLVRAISREHLRRVLKKGGSICAACAASS